MIASEGVAEIFRSLRRWMGSAGFDQAVESAKKNTDEAVEFPPGEFDSATVAEMIRIFVETDNRRRKQLAKMTSAAKSAAALAKNREARTIELTRCIRAYADGLEDGGKMARQELGEND